MLREKTKKKFSMRYFILFLAAVSALGGCATSPGQLKESNQNWQQEIISANYQEVYRRLKDGFNKCTPGEFESDLYPDKKLGYFDVFIPLGMPPGRTGWALGHVDFQFESKNSTWVKVGVRNHPNSPLDGEEGKHSKKWLRWASGDLDCGN